MGRSGRVYKPLFGALAFLGFIIWMLLVGVLESGGRTNTTINTLNQQQAGGFKRVEMAGREKLGKEKVAVHPDYTLNYMMSKRKVPNGADPIHNRRTGNSRQPPDQA